MLTAVALSASLLSLAAAVPAASPLEAAAQRLRLNFAKKSAAAAPAMVGIVNGRETEPGEWEGTVMVIGETGDCADTGLCTGMFIHP